MSYSGADSLLRQIASGRNRESITSSYNELGESMQSIGAPTNNVLLSSIHSETKRTGDELSALNSHMRMMNAKADQTNELLARLTAEIAKQSEILSALVFSSSSSSSPTTVAAGSKRTYGGPTKQYYFQGTRLTSKHHNYACLIHHLIGMVHVHLEASKMYYQDSVDCTFKTLLNAVRVVSGIRSGHSSVENKGVLELQDKDSQAFVQLYDIIASQDKDTPTTVPESSMELMYNIVTKPVFQDVLWIKQRLCLLDGVLSPRQIDALRSLNYPLALSESPHELNWDQSIPTPRLSHPLTKDIVDLPQQKRNIYMELKVRGQTTAEALRVAQLGKVSVEKVSTESE
ncbi:TPA_asm: hypothetical protein GF920_14645 [Listeria monocytogenes]|nr:hypothetical protein [Listeria monocytogenes]HAA5805826.1 hypothetical protein [Listeria monocytogenes]HAA5926469.1 hypothetical protein [Listeria monocytogenes]HAA5947457.1 hypothetical protein [Listeria monocytogenes]HAB0455575.1 hypothetical protein [Listeria monocytogenes]